MRQASDGRPPWGLIAATVLVSLVGSVLLVGNLLRDVRPSARALHVEAQATEPRATETAPPSPTPIPSAIAIVAASATPIATASATPSPFPSLTPSVTPVPPGADFTGAFVEDVTWLEDGRTMVRLLVPKGLLGVYRAEVQASVPADYLCFIPQGLNNRLDCVGPRLAEGVTATIRVYHAGHREQPVYEAQFLAAGDF